MMRYIWTRGFQENLLCGSGERFRDSPFWRSVIDHAFGGFDGIDAGAMHALQLSLDRTRHVPRLALNAHSTDANRDLTTYSEVLTRLYRAVQSVSGCRVIIDSSKYPSHAFVLDRIAALDVKLVHLVRDSRAVAFSWQRRLLRPETAESSAMGTFSPFATALGWSGVNAALQLYGRRQRAYAFVRYEDLARSPTTVMERLVERLQLPSGDLAFLERSDYLPKSTHSVSGNPMRFREGPLRIALDEAWRTEMPAAARMLVTSLTWPLLVPYSYRV